MTDDELAAWMTPPPELVRGCDSPEGVRILADWLDDHGGDGAEFRESQRDSAEIPVVGPAGDEGDGSGRGDDYGHADGDGHGSGLASGFGAAGGFGDGLHLGNGNGDGRGDGDGARGGDGGLFPPE